MDLKEKTDLKESLNGVESENAFLSGIGEEDYESQLLLPDKKGGLSKKSGNPGRKVQWNDTNGNKLVEVLEFQPSDASDSDGEESESCLCTVM